ncbi:START-2 domain protein [Trifolium medium]|uniref:START-2 domain protein n=1 Tax=Trifolium medium TaxID=97028 RepID=A0A392NHH6_9FABA|nr:START-2 domain protein [Trifolium medium]
MKPPWPLSTREAIVHFYLFEYFQDDLIVVLLKTVTELEKINETIDGLKNDVIPEAKGAVRIDVLGGIVMQKVTSERSYIR